MEILVGGGREVACFFFHGKLHAGMLGVQVVKQLLRVIGFVNDDKRIVYLAVPTYRLEGGCAQGFFLRVRHIDFSYDG